MESDDTTLPETPRKPSIPIHDGLRDYLLHFRRERDLPVSVDQDNFSSSVIMALASYYRRSAVSCRRWWFAKVCRVA